MSKKLHILVIAGEISSDKHGAKLIRELKNNSGDRLYITAVGGNRMKAVADKLEENIVFKAAVGFAEVIKLIPFLLELKRRLVKKYFCSNSPERIDGLVLIDYPGFNVRLAKIAKKYDLPVFYYITPQVWAWGKNRIKILSETCRKLYCLFEFEKDLFVKAGGNVEFVGHPVLEDIPEKIEIGDINSELCLADNDFVIALLPGSRVTEVKRHLPVIIEAVKDMNCRVILGKSPAVDEELVKGIAGDIQITDNIYTLLKRADMAVISSGTTTLESAVIGTPFITVYKVSESSYIIAKLLVSIEYISMVNILAGKEIVPELIQHEFNSGSLKQEIETMFNNDVREKIKDNLDSVARMIGKPGASLRTAKSILEELDS